MLCLARVGGKSYFCCIAKLVQQMRCRVPGVSWTTLLPRSPPRTSTFTLFVPYFSISIHPQFSQKSPKPYSLSLSLRDSRSRTCDHLHTLLRVFSTSLCLPRHQRKEIKVRVIECDIPLVHSWQYECTVAVMLRVIMILRKFYVFM